MTHALNATQQDKQAIRNAVNVAKQGTDTVTGRQRIDAIIASYRAGLLSVAETLRCL